MGHKQDCPKDPAPASARAKKVFKVQSRLSFPHDKGLMSRRRATVTLSIGQS